MNLLFLHTEGRTVLLKKLNSDNFAPMLVEPTCILVNGVEIKAWFGGKTIFFLEMLIKPLDYSLFKKTCGMWVLQVTDLFLHISFQSLF